MGLPREHEREGIIVYELTFYASNIKAPKLVCVLDFTFCSWFDTKLAFNPWINVLGSFEMNWQQTYRVYVQVR